MNRHKIKHENHFSSTRLPADYEKPMLLLRSAISSECLIIIGYSEESRYRQRRHIAFLLLELCILSYAFRCYFEITNIHINSIYLYIYNV